MMKKLLMILALMLLTGGSALADEAETRDAYIGMWELRSLSLLGVELGAEELDYAVFLNIHEDDTCLLEMGESFAVVGVQYTDGVCSMQAPAGDIPLTLDEQGVMHLSITVDGLTMAMQLVRGEAAAASPEIMPYTGLWMMESAEMPGRRLTAGELGEITLSVYDDHSGMIMIPDGIGGCFRLMSVDGGIAMIDTDGLLYPITLENGQLRLTLVADGADIQCVMNRVGEAPVAAEDEQETEPAAEVQSAKDDAIEAAAASVAARRRVIVTADTARVRETPDISAELVKTAHQGDTFIYLDEIENWYIIECNGRKSYIHKGVSAIE